jgi:hypothetical protein
MSPHRVPDIEEGDHVRVIGPRGTQIEAAVMQVLPACEDGSRGLWLLTVPSRAAVSAASAARKAADCEPAITSR